MCLEDTENLLYVKGLKIDITDWYCYKNEKITLFTAGKCSITLKRTVLASGLHCPMVTTSPSPTFWKAGVQWTEMFLCFLPKRLYLEKY